MDDLNQYLSDGLEFYQLKEARGEFFQQKLNISTSSRVLVLSTLTMRKFVILWRETQRHQSNFRRILRTKAAVKHEGDNYKILFNSP